MNRVKLNNCRTFINEMVTSFSYAFDLHSNGESKDAILIRYDIVAAGSKDSEAILKSHRCAVLSGIEAVDAGVARSIAVMMYHAALTRHADELLQKLK